MIKFETINGTLCRMVEPKPLTEKSLTHYTPCAIRPIKDNTQIGKLNKRTIYSGLSNCDGVYILNERQIGTGSYKNMIYAPWGSAHNFEQFEIIGYPIEEGSHWWALWAMMEGHEVRNPYIHGGAERFAVRDGRIVHHVRNAFEDYCAVDSQFFPPAGLSTGWQLYKEPKPEPPREPEYVTCKRCGGTGYETKPESAKEQWLKPNSTLIVETIQLCNTKRSNND